MRNEPSLISIRVRPLSVAHPFRQNPTRNESMNMFWTEPGGNRSPSARQLPGPKCAPLAPGVVQIDVLSDERLPRHFEGPSGSRAPPVMWNIDRRLNTMSLMGAWLGIGRRSSAFATVGGRGGVIVLMHAVDGRLNRFVGYRSSCVGVRVVLGHSRHLFN